MLFITGWHALQVIYPVLYKPKSAKPDKITLCSTPIYQGPIRATDVLGNLFYETRTKEQTQDLNTVHGLLAFT